MEIIARKTVGMVQLNSNFSTKTLNCSQKRDGDLAQVFNYLQFVA